MVGIWLSILSFFDIKNKMLPTWILILYGGSALGSQLWKRNLLQWSSVFALLLGATFFLISYFSKEKFGYGDAITIFITAVYLNIWEILKILWLSMFLVFLTAFLFSLFRNWKVKTQKTLRISLGEIRIPYVPYLTVAYFLYLFIQ